MRSFKGADVLTGHSEFYLTRPTIYFGVFDHPEENSLFDLEGQAEFQFRPFFMPTIQQTSGLYIDWYDLPK